MEGIKMGDMVICQDSGVVGWVIKQYYPTSCAQQTMVQTIDGRHYHAPTSTWRPYRSLPKAGSAASPEESEADHGQIPHL